VAATATNSGLTFYKHTYARMASQSAISTTSFSEGLFQDSEQVLSHAGICCRCVILLTAVVAYNDSMAIGAILAAQLKRARVPDKLSIIGFDGLTVGAYVFPPLSTIAVHRDNLGIYAARELTKLMDGSHRVGRPVVVDTFYEERASTARPSA
jgi:DNA-binding LacI/PurR family transcriptional regulator